MTVNVDQKKIMHEVLHGGVSPPSFIYQRGILSGTAIQPHHVTVFV